jgi:hypothetical protein
MTNLERWKRRFRHGAAKAYRWDVSVHLTRHGPRRLLRACREDGMPLQYETCPLTMQAHFDGFQSMLAMDIVRVIAAADDAPEADRDLRAELLHMCGVEEP